MRPLAGFELLKDNLWNTYFQSPKGLLFAIVPPASLALFFTAPQGLYVWYQTAAWLLFATLVLTTANALSGNRTVFERYPIPITFFILLPLLRALLSYGIAYGTLIAFLCVAGFPPVLKNGVLGFVFVLPLAALGFGLGLLLSVIHYLYQWKVSIFLLAPCLLIFWKFQPLSALILFPSKAFLDGDLSGMRLFGMASAVAFVFLFISLRFFWIAEKRLFKKCP